MKPVFDTISEHLKTEVPAIKKHERWNNQLAEEARENVRVFPCSFLELQGVKTTTVSKGIQHCEGILRIRHCTKSLRTAEVDAYDLEAATYLALQNFTGGPLLVGLERSAIYPDPNHDAVEMVISEYRIKYADRTRYDQLFSPHSAQVETKTATQ
ncbi:hypothetical protein [Hymenobacter sp. B81]|uniref:hypothetical protein n=1 Tax=Hymenobacter sp. B81 TaxID=3344878 RepID=UPI0037DD50B5